MRVSKNWVKFNKMFTLSPWAEYIDDEYLNNSLDMLEQNKRKNVI